MKNELMNINELKELLGYTEYKSVKKWCAKNDVPIIQVGASKYTHPWLVDIALMRNLHKESFLSGLDADSIIQAIVNDDKVALAEAMEAPLDSSAKSNFKKKKETSIEGLFDTYKKKRA